MHNFFDIKFTGWNKVSECNVWVDKYFDYYVLDFAESGSLELIIENAPPVRLTGPVAWLTFPGVRFEFGKRPPEADSWHHRYIAFHGSFADELVARGIFTVDSPVIQIHNSARFVTAFEDLLVYLENPRQGNDRAAVMLEGLLLQLHEQERELKFDRMDSRIKTLVNNIKKSPVEHWDFRREAGKLKLSYSHFRKLFTDGMNLPPNAFLISERMNLAARMLKDSALPLSEIAELCGYEDIYHFNKSFKLHHAIPPGKFRQQMMSLQ